MSCGVRAHKALFYKVLRVLSFCLEMSNGVDFCRNSVVEWAVIGMELHENKG